MQRPRSRRPSIAASARPTRSLKGDLAHVEEPRWPDTLSLVAALNFYSPDPPPPGLYGGGVISMSVTAFGRSPIGFLRDGIPSTNGSN